VIKFYLAILIFSNAACAPAQPDLQATVAAQATQLATLQRPTPTERPESSVTAAPTPTLSSVPGIATPSAFSAILPRPPALDCKPHSLPQRTQRSLAVDPVNDQHLYIGIEQEGFFRSSDGGATWQRATTGIKAWNRLDGTGLCYEEFYETIIDPKNPQRICISMAGGPGTINIISSAGNNGVYCSSDRAMTWMQRVTPTMNTAVYALAADPTDFDIMYAGVNGGPCGNPPPMCQPNTYFNTVSVIYKTTDGGKNWTELNALYVQDLRVITLHLDQKNSKVIIASTFSKLPPQQGGPGQFDAVKQIGLLKSTDSGATWKSIIKGMSAEPREQALLNMQVSPTNAMRLYATASSNTSYWSSDGGETLNKAERMAAFAFNPHDPTGMHILGTGGEFVKESKDGGISWAVKSKTPSFVTFGRGDDPTDIEWSRTNPNTVFLAGAYASIYKTMDGGTTWSQILSANKLPK